MDTALPTLPAVETKAEPEQAPEDDNKKKRNKKRKGDEAAEDASDDETTPLFTKVPGGFGGLGVASGSGFAARKSRKIGAVAAGALQI